MLQFFSFHTRLVWNLIRRLRRRHHRAERNPQKTLSRSRNVVNQEAVEPLEETWQHALVDPLTSTVVIIILFVTVHRSSFNACNKNCKENFVWKSFQIFKKSHAIFSVRVLLQRTNQCYHRQRS